MKDEEYPAIVPRPEYRTRGVVYDGISDDGMGNLDEFEGEMYLRIPVRVTLASGEVLLADTYAFRPEFSHLLDTTHWCFESFLKHGKSEFVSRYVGFSRIG